MNNNNTLQAAHDYLFGFTVTSRADCIVGIETVHVRRPRRDLYLGRGRQFAFRRVAVTRVGTLISLNDKTYTNRVAAEPRKTRIANNRFFFFFAFYPHDLR